MFTITEDDLKKVLINHMMTTNPFVIKNVPSKDKRKFILCGMIIHFFTENHRYTEKEVNEILKPMSKHYVDFRRYLIEFKFLDRKTDGSAYWLIINHEDYQNYKIW